MGWLDVVDGANAMMPVVRLRFDTINGEFLSLVLLCFFFVTRRSGNKSDLCQTLIELQSSSDALQVGWVVRAGGGGRGESSAW